MKFKYIDKKLHKITISKLAKHFNILEEYDFDFKYAINYHNFDHDLKSKNEKFNYSFLNKTNYVRAIYYDIYKSNLTNGYYYNYFKNIIEKKLKSLNVHQIALPNYNAHDKNDTRPSLFKYPKDSIFSSKLLNKNAFKDTNKSGKIIYFKVKIGSLYFNFYKSKNKDHPRVYGKFTQLSGIKRFEVLNKHTKDQWICIDLNNSHPQHISRQSNCPQILKKIASFSLVDNIKEKNALLTNTMSFFSKKQTVKNKLKDREIKLVSFFKSKNIPQLEIDNYLNFCKTNNDTNELFRFEDTLRNYAKKKRLPTCHDSIYLPLKKRELINEIIDILDNDKIIYKIEIMDNSNNIKKISKSELFAN